LYWFLLSWALPLQAQEVQTSETPGIATRSTVRLLALGGLTQARLSALRALIDAELEGAEVELVIESGGGPVAVWVEQSQRDPSTIVIAVLDTRQPNHWQVTIVDAARKRAIKRRLPWGMAEDAAALEAVASIVVSAVAALQDGLEVASQSVEEVLRDSELHGDAPPEAQEAQVQPAPDRGQSPETPAALPEAARPKTWTIDAGVIGALASFAPAEKMTWGLGATLGVTWVSHLAARLSAVRFREAVFQSELGEFRSTRTMFGLAVGPHFEIEPLELVPEARFVVELNERRSVAGAAGVTALEEAVVSRYGALAGALCRYVPGQYVGVSLYGGAGYLPRRVKYVVTPNNEVIAELWPWLLVAELALELRLP